MDPSVRHELGDEVLAALGGAFSSSIAFRRARGLARGVGERPTVGSQDWLHWKPSLAR